MRKRLALIAPARPPPTSGRDAPPAPARCASRLATDGPATPAQVQAAVPARAAQRSRDRHAVPCARLVLQLLDEVRSDPPPLHRASPLGFTEFASARAGVLSTTTRPTPGRLRRSPRIARRAFSSSLAAASLRRQSEWPGMSGRVYHGQVNEFTYLVISVGIYFSKVKMTVLSPPSTPM